MDYVKEKQEIVMLVIQNEEGEVARLKKVYFSLF